MAQVSRPGVVKRREAVSSSSIASVGYDAGTKTLEVEFNGGRVYRYYGVPGAVHSQLLEASSVGAYFNANVRDKFPYEQL
jgi:hypothetical protein